MGQSFTYDLNQTPDISKDVEFSLCDMTTGGVSQESIQQCEKTSESVPFIPPTFDKTHIDLNDALDFSLDSHPSISLSTFDETPSDLYDALDSLLDSHPFIGLPTINKNPIDLSDALDFSLESHPSIGPPTFDKIPID